MADKWTADEVAWLQEHYHEGTIADTIDAMAQRFGNTRSRQAVFVKANSLGLQKDKHGEDRNRRCEKAIRWTKPQFKREYEFMLANDTTESVQPTIEKFYAEFGVRLTRSQVSLFRSTHGNRKRRSHGGGSPCRPIGATCLGKDGYLKVKVKEWPDNPCTKDNWRFMHHVVWEEANGRPVPEGCVIMFADKDKSNMDPQNLVAVPRRLVGPMNAPGSPDWCDRETLLACIQVAELRAAVLDAEERKPRTCGVCGAEFVSPRRNWRHPPVTCPDCLKAGKKARGDRGDKKQLVCPVCGDTFGRSSKMQVRCPACCQAKPHWSATRHRRWFEIHGSRG